MLRKWREWRTKRVALPTVQDEPAACRVDCPIAMCTLTACIAGGRATVRGLHCALPEADRLRILGVYEGASVGIIDRRNGVLLDVCGSRLALDASVAGAIVVEPTAA